MEFTDTWILQPTNKKDSQQDLLKAMGRKQWQINLIDKADEIFKVKIDTNAKGETIIHKEVTIYLNHGLAKLCKVLRLPFHKVEYGHTLIADGEIMCHPDDDKDFGPCTSRTFWKKSRFTIQWYLKRGIILVVKHSINADDTLIVELSIKGTKIKAIKRYKRLDSCKTNNE
jgi:hypothetical protein